MASNTRKLKMRRKRRNRSMGKARKTKQNVEGTTPIFPIQPE